VTNPGIQVNDHGPGPAPGVVLVALQRAHTSGVARLGQGYLNEGVPTSGLLTWAFDELVAAGLGAWANPDPDGLRQVQ
jgi:hypothetical protein